MNANFNLDSIKLLIIFALPGIISMKVYRLIMPAKSINWSTVVFEGFFYSCVNFILLLPIIVIIHSGNFIQDHPFLYIIFGIGILFIGPILWPFVFRKLLRYKKLTMGLQLPFPTAWDFFFDQRIPVFLLIHLKDGKMVGGYYGKKSYATSYPNHGDVYLELVYRINNDGSFGAVIEDSRGLLIRKEDYTYIEVFEIPSQP